MRALHDGDGAPTFDIVFCEEMAGGFDGVEGGFTFEFDACVAESAEALEGCF